jgi:hypothetical protein
MSLPISRILIAGSTILPIFFSELDVSNLQPALVIDHPQRYLAAIDHPNQIASPEKNTI